MASGGVDAGLMSAPRPQSICEAAQMQNTDAVLELLDSGQACDVNEQDMDGNTALHWASWFLQDNLVDRLLEGGARVDIVNTTGESPIHWAARASNIHAMEVLSKGDPDLFSVRDCDGFTALIILAQSDNAPVMEWLYLRGISVEEQDNWGRTSLQWACYQGHRRTVQWLLSRSASIAHRDHEGMTSMHWAALKGQEVIADMLLDVGGVHLLNASDCSGDTPIDLAMRKRFRHLVINFHKCQLFNFLFGRPFLSHNHYANFFVAFIVLNIAVFILFVLPGVGQRHMVACLVWSLCMAVSLALWWQACHADPGWIVERTILPQVGRLKRNGETWYAPEQPVESQMVGTRELAMFAPGDELSRLEQEQSKFDCQRHLIVAARRHLEDATKSTQSSVSSGFPPGGSVRTTELQSLVMEDAMRQSGQLDRASLELRRRAHDARADVGARRVAWLVDQGRGDYVELLEKGCFKQICTVCRTEREVRSHHCKECGRCVRRLDHHCPWIDNCVGLGNQRTFFCFIVMLFVTIISYYYVAFLYVVDVIVGEWTWWPRLRPFLVLGTCLFDGIWLVFVSMLMVRHVAYIVANVTTYEVLVRPVHMQRRFPKSNRRLWFLQGCSFANSIRHCVNYWTLNAEVDMEDFTLAAGFTEPTREEEGDPEGGDGDEGDDVDAGRLSARSGYVADMPPATSRPRMSD
eukprot:TRINITY_DN43004_c0_g1_i1.p1 TRINITY_DN43004_c0_g1~~TRINITY_DN43004_c0_g1_i1.p1  ORF type:complete len:691 (-),score=94.61 TRINITY_DN43004_c0_g1_i1:117-2189(-)